MKYFDKRMALDAIEDVLTDTRTSHGRGVAAGLCGAFYMSGLLSEDEWGIFLARIPVEPHTDGVRSIRKVIGSGARVRGRFSN